VSGGECGQVEENRLEERVYRSTVHALLCVGYLKSNPSPCLENY
jgi:hypothetical protein